MVGNSLDLHSIFIYWQTCGYIIHTHSLEIDYIPPRRCRIHLRIPELICWAALLRSSPAVVQVVPSANLHTTKFDDRLYSKIDLKIF